PRLARAIAAEPRLGATAATAAYFLAADGTPKTAGTELRNPALAATLARIAAEGPDAFYRGAIAAAIVAAVAAGPNPGTLSDADLAAYRPVRRDPVCGPYRVHIVCGVPPPSAGGIAIVQILAVLAPFDPATVAALDTRARHLFAEANRLAYADRDRHVADPAFVAVPTAGLVDPAYLAARARLIDPAATRGPVPAGTPGGAGTAFADDTLSGEDATSHLSVVDAEGNAVALTTTVESVFGARIMAAGFVLNNQLTDFAFLPEIDGRPVANRLEPGKRPRSAMSPTIVLDADRRLVMTLGSPGGSAIIAYVARTLIAALDGRKDMSRAIAEPNIVNRNSATEIERGSTIEALVPALEALGHTIARPRLESGLHGIRVLATGLDGGADPRREGVVRGD
ncbi:MAG: gamma-glutamyltransferase, partial [Alphaproteobacteria bacterium]|nr:gamma-glutamyltransferase [Alphaproteobacteria bacterium]